MSILAVRFDLHGVLYIMFQTAEDNHAALVDFMNHWPEYADNDFYVTGESYAGVYVPTLSARLMNDPLFNFKVSCSPEDSRC